MIVGDWNTFNFREAASMVRQPTGSYVYEAEATSDTLAYQLLGVADGGRSINGTAADSFEWDGNGDYRSILLVKPGRVRIEFEPKQLPVVVRAAAGDIAFDEDHEYLNRVFQLVSQAEETQRELLSVFRSHSEAGKALQEFRYDVSNLKNMLSMMTKHENTFVR